jgi:hypothetical protein
MIPDDILEFCETMDFEPSSAQRQVFEYISGGKHGFRMGKGEGCTTALAMIALWRTLRSPGTVTLLVAATDHQSQEILHQAHRLVLTAPEWVKKLFEFSSIRATVAGDPTWRMFAIPASNPDVFRGWMHRTLTIVIDGVIPPEITEVIRQIASGPENLIVQGIT